MRTYAIVGEKSSSTTESYPIAIAIGSLWGHTNPKRNQAFMLDLLSTPCMHRPPNRLWAQTQASELNRKKKTRQLENAQFRGECVILYLIE